MLIADIVLSLAYLVSQKLKATRHRTFPLIYLLSQTSLFLYYIAYMIRDIDSDESERPRNCRSDQYARLFDGFLIGICLSLFTNSFANRIIQLLCVLSVSLTIIGLSAPYVSAFETVTAALAVLFLILIFYTRIYHEKIQFYINYSQRSLEQFRTIIENQIPSSIIVLSE